jgi:hypothetical protein
MVFLLEPGAGKLACPVLKGPRRSNASGLPDQQIRMVKIRQKVSGSLRTLDRAQQFALIRSYLATATAHGRNIMHALTELATGRPWLPATGTTT